MPLVSPSARAAAYDAKANESLTLIARGSGAVYEAAYEGSAQAATDRLADMVRADSTQTRLPSLLTAYTATHAAIRDADNGGDWNAAVELATSTTDGSANATFSAFDTAAKDVLNTQVTNIVRAFDQIGGRYLPWASGLAAALAALLAGRAMSQRIEEYR